MTTPLEDLIRDAYTAGYYAAMCDNGRTADTDPQPEDEDQVVERLLTWTT